MDGRLPAIISVNRFVSSIFSCSILLLGNVRISMVYTRRGPYPATALQVGTVLFRGAQQPPVLTRCPGASSSSGGSLELASGLWSPFEAAGIWVPARPIYISSAKNGKIGVFGGGGGLGSALWVGEGIQLMGVVVIKCDLRFPHVGVPWFGCPLVWVSLGMGVPWCGCPSVWVPIIFSVLWGAPCSPKPHENSRTYKRAELSSTGGESPRIRCPGGS